MDNTNVTLSLLSSAWEPMHYLHSRRLGLRSTRKRPRHKSIQSGPVPDWRLQNRRLSALGAEPGRRAARHPSPTRNSVSVSAIEIVRRCFSAAIGSTGEQRNHTMRLPVLRRRCGGSSTFRSNRSFDLYVSLSRKSDSCGELRRRSVGRPPDLASANLRFVRPGRISSIKQNER
jgi:hypothetical protein